MRWFAMSTRTLSDPKVEQLGEKHGTIGPMVWISLLCEAGLQEKGGVVERTYRQIAHEVFSDADTVREVIDSVVDVGLCHAVSRDVRGFKIELPKWKTWQATGRKASERAAKKSHDKANVSDRHEESHDVPYKTVQDKKKENARASIPKHLDPILQTLDHVAHSRSLGIKVEAAVKACEDFADRDLAFEADKFHRYYIEGAGENRRIPDVAEKWREWLESAPSAAARGGVRVTKAPKKDRSKYDRGTVEARV